MPDDTKVQPPVVDEEDVNIGEAIDELNTGGEEPESGGEEKSPQGVSAPDQTALAARLDKLEEENIALRQRSDIMNGQMSILRERERTGQQPAQETPQPRRIRIPTKEELALKLSNPDTAVDGMHALLTDLGTQFQEMIDETRSEAGRAFQQRDVSNRLNSALADDQKATLEEYGADLIKDPEFIRDADAEGDKLARRRGHTNYTPGDFNLLATRTYKTWLESGKLDAWNTKRQGTNGGNRLGSNGVKPPSLREVTRSVGRSDFIDNTSGRPGETSSLSELYNGDAREIRIARANMKKMGLTEKEWVASFRASRAEDPSFGN